MKNREVDVDEFASALSDIIGEVRTDCVDASNKAVTQSIRKGAKTVRANAEKGGLHEWSEKYVKGFRSHVNKSGVLSEGEIGNKGKPGLVHLLEKGHATLTGRRTKAYPHMAPAFEEIKDDYVKRMEKLIGEALK